MLKDSKMSEKVVYLESLGCNRNTVDSEIMLSLLEERGYKITQKPEEASIIIVNTCAFIDEAKEEAINTIFELSRYKKSDSKLIVTGCFPQLYHKEIIREMPEVDAVLGTGNLNAIIYALENQNQKRDFPAGRYINSEYREYINRKKLLTLPGYAYMKISEGCSRKCSFCLIPLIKGRLRSRKIENIVMEACLLEKMGTKELVLTSQDTLHYGQDLGMRRGLTTLVESLIRETDIEFIRLLYLSPTHELIENLDIFDNERVFPYFDIPIQHVSKKMLKNMNRIGDYDYFKDIINRIRERFHNAILRTTAIVGYPCETEDDFAQLMCFIKEMKFNHLGVFTFSPQRKTEAYNIKGRVNKNIALMRKMKLVELQKEISLRHLENNIGKVFPVIIEEKLSCNHLFFGRSYHFAPEVDGVFLVRSSKDIKPGSVVNVKVTRADYYDLHGVRIRDS